VSVPAPQPEVDSATPPAPTPARPSRRDTLLTLGRRLYAVAMVGLLIFVLVDKRDDLVRVASGARPWVLVAVCVTTFGQLAISSAFWSSALRGWGSPVGWPACFDATLASAPTRYLPGGIWYAVGRVAILRRRGARTSTLSAVAALEMVLVPVVGFALGGLMVAAAAGDAPLTAPGLIAAVVVLAAVSSPPAVNLALRLLARWRGTTHEPLTWALHLRLVGWTVAVWIFQAFNFALYLIAFPNVHVGGPVEVAGAYMIAWGVGWLAIFAPQGLGVFEATLTTILVGHTAAGLALVVGGYRAVIAVRDAIGYAGALLARRVHPLPEPS
jgi:uncharacterized membrane protein YbhN (UPF0104 family)